MKHVNTKQVKVNAINGKISIDAKKSQQHIGGNIYGSGHVGGVNKTAPG